MNIQTTLAKCRAELKRQKEVKQYQRSWSEKARLAVADRMLAGIDDSNPSAEWFVDVAAHLLGVEVVE